MGVITDPISDLLIRIKNANQRKNRNVTIPYSKFKEEILKILVAQGYIVDYVVEGKETKKDLNVNLKYVGNQRVITGVKRISKPGLKVYATSENIPSVLSGFGTVIISTSKGLLTDKQARKENVGGEVIAYIW